ncbi:MAG: nucleotidyl transferase AbiEii/AbiGii toxin family protein [Lachnospiraceae bacterium]|nr:nucleotidyl transferase AbiEii/AbiGii toxin family protein [Lachnospiraceae bacterium]
MTPGAEKHIFRDVFDSDEVFELWSYPMETVLAEKVETILSRSIGNTRPRDFYDVYTLSGYPFDLKVFRDAFKATAEHRGSIIKIVDIKNILDMIENDPLMQKRWNDYTKLMPYAAGIDFSDTIGAIRKMFHL